MQPDDKQSYRALYSIAVGTTGVRLDLFYPIFLTLQFAFFVGWLKVTRELVVVLVEILSFRLQRLSLTHSVRTMTTSN